MTTERDDLEDTIIELEQQIAEAESDVNVMKAVLESLTYQLLELDNEEF